MVTLCKIDNLGHDVRYEEDESPSSVPYPAMVAPVPEGGHPARDGLELERRILTLASRSSDNPEISSILALDSSEIGLNTSPVSTARRRGRKRPFTLVG